MDMNESISLMKTTLTENASLKALNDQRKLWNFFVSDFNIMGYLSSIKCFVSNYHPNVKRFASLQYSR